MGSNEYSFRDFLKRNFSPFESRRNVLIWVVSAVLTVGVGAIEISASINYLNDLADYEAGTVDVEPDRDDYGLVGSVRKRIYSVFDK